MIREISRTLTARCMGCKDTFTVHTELQLEREVLETNPNYERVGDSDTYNHKCGSPLRFYAIP